MDPDSDNLERSFPCETAHDGVAFYADELPQRCLKCGLEGPVWVRHQLKSAFSGGYRTLVVRTLDVNLPICRRCNARWALAIPLVVLAFFTPFLLITAAALLRMPERFFGPLIMIAMLSPIAIVVLARKWSLRVKSIDHDGMIEMRGVHPEVRGEIVAFERG